MDARVSGRAAREASSSRGTGDAKYFLAMLVPHCACSCRPSCSKQRLPGWRPVSVRRAPVVSCFQHLADVDGDYGSWVSAVIIRGAQYKLEPHIEIGSDLNKPYSKDLNQTLPGAVKRPRRLIVLPPR